MIVSFIIVAYNASKTLHTILNDLILQDYELSKIEVILIDGNSEDNTKKIMLDFCKKNNLFNRIIVLDNPQRTLPCGWNIALKAAKGDIYLRVDAHASTLR
jgi:glycosyltransferase involved in cell wall biosynthesis